MNAKSFKSLFVGVIAAAILCREAAFAQPVRIAVGTASVASLPTWVAKDGGYFTREVIELARECQHAGADGVHATAGPRRRWTARSKTTSAQSRSQ